MQRRDRAMAAVLVSATLGVAWGITAAAGLIDVPRTDDWGFAREAFSLHGGHLRLINWGPMTKIGLLLWAQPFLWVFGNHHWALAVATSVLVAAGLLAAYALARMRLPMLTAAGAVTVLLLFPGVVRDVATFMTDPAALWLQIITLALGAASLRSEDGPRRWAFFGAAMVAGLWGFSVRELAVAAPLAVIGVAFGADRDPERRRRVAVAGASFVILAAGVWLWHRGLRGVEAYRGRPALSQSLILVVSCAITVALAVAPALALSVGRWWSARHRAGRLCGAIAGAVVVAARPLLALHVDMHNWWLVGDYLQPDGINGGKMLVGYRPIVLNDSMWHVLIGIACLSTVACGSLIGEWIAVRVSREGRTMARTEDPVARLVAMHAGFVALVLVVAAVWNGALFDRYTWPLIFSGSLVLMWRSPVDERPSSRANGVAQVVGTIAVVIALGTSVLLTLNSAAFDSARWRAAERAVAAGTPPDQVDGGIEWDGIHSDVVNLAGTPTTADPLLSWWSHMTGMPKVCVVITASPVDSPLGSEIGTFRWRPWLVTGHATLHVYRLSAPVCP